jgi:cysteine-rich repeat protein
MTRMHLDRAPLLLVTLGLGFAPLGCTPDAPTGFTSFGTTLGNTEFGDGDGDGDTETGDVGDGDGDGDSMGDGDGDGDGEPGDGDGDGDGDAGPDCGNAVVDPGEECDVGPETMFCDGDCTYAMCGDGYHNMLSEQCDDGNSASDDGCVGACVVNVCGDGIVWVGTEQCDDNNMINTDACKNDCTLAICGDNVIQDEVEQCEDLNMIDDDACTNACQNAMCGDGILWANMEVCDDGNLDDNDMCPGSCEPAYCGDGYTLLNDEECDDGNMIDDDFCHNDCTTEGWYDPFETNNLLLLPWMTNGNVNWSTNNTLPHEGSYSAASGNNLGDSQSTNLQVTLNLPQAGVVRFWYKVGSEGSFDYLRFYIDNVQQQNAAWSGNVPWAMAQYNVGQGQHTFRWTYSKDGSITTQPDKAWIDEVYIGLP